MKLRFRSIKRGIKNLFRRDHKEQEYRRLAIHHANLQKFQADIPHHGKTAAEAVASITRIRAVEEQPKDTIFGGQEEALLAAPPREPVDVEKSGGSSQRARQTRQVSDHMLQSPSRTLPVQNRSVTMPELGNRMSQTTVAHNVPMRREEVVPVRIRSSRIARVPVLPDQRYPSFVRF